MSSVTPPPPPSPPATPPPPAPSVVVQQPPPALLALEIGAKLEVRVAGTDGQGRILIDTPVGQLAVQSNTALPSSGPLQLQIQSLGAQALFLITAIHGKSPAAALRALSGLLPPTLPGQSSHLGQTAAGTVGTPGQHAGQTTGSASGPGSTRAAAVPVQLTAGTTLRAVLLRGGTAITGTSASAGGTGSPTQAGGSAHAPAGAAGSQMGTARALANAARSISGAAGVGNRGAGGPPTGGTATSSLPAGTSFTVRVLNVQPGAQPGAQSGAQTTTGSLGTTPLSAGLQLSGTVSSSGAGGLGGQTVIQTHAGPIALATANQLPPGTRVALEVIEMPKPMATAEQAAMTRRLGEGILQSHQWPALDDAAETLSELHPTMIQQLTTAVLPRVDHALGANLLFFLFALRGGDVRQWLGDGPARALERLKPGLLGRLRDDFSGISKLAEEPPKGEARVIPFPFANGAEIEQARLLVRRQAEEDEDDENQGGRPGPGTRFVVDVTLSRFGRLQFDGFVQDGTKRFDLIVRSERKLEAQVQNGIREIFQGAGEISGAKGGLAFQAAPPGFVDTDGKKPQSGVGVLV